jgi:hypothetical protein
MVKKTVSNVHNKIIEFPEVTYSMLRERANGTAVWVNRTEQGVQLLVKEGKSTAKGHITLPGDAKVLRQLAEVLLDEAALYEEPEFIESSEDKVSEVENIVKAD